MTGRAVLGLRPSTWRLVGAAGLLLGVAYTLSPLTVWFALAIVWIVRLAVRGVDEDERRWITVMLVAAIALRVVAIAGLFTLTNHDQLPFGNFFGDEEYFIKRSIWLRNVALGLPVHPADLIYAFAEVGETSYLYVLAFIQVLVGPSPYGVHLVSVTFYIAAAVVLYRLVRQTLGRMPAFGGLALLLFLPSLFVWSISALKEPAFFLMSATTIAMVVRVARARSWTERAIALAVIIAIVAVLDTVRRAGTMLTAASLAMGVLIAFVVIRPRLLLATLVVAPIALGAVLTRPGNQLRVYNAVRRSAWQHQGHINTPGYVYKTLDERFYLNTSEIDSMTSLEAGRFVVRSIVKYLTVPLPWEVQSRAALVYLPEQLVWYSLLALLPAGVVFAFRRDPLVTGLLVAHAVFAALLVAMVSGNVGTLVRHRGMATPYVVWLGALGGCELLTRLVRAKEAPPGTRPVRSRMEPTWE